MKSVIHLSVLLTAGLLLLVSCKDSPKKNTRGNTGSKTAIQAPERKPIGSTGLSLISKYKWKYGEQFSKLSDADKKSYLVKETYQAEVRAGYCVVSYVVAKDGIKLSLKNAIAGAISGLAGSSGTEIENRIDSVMTNRYGAPAIYSKGYAKAKKTGGRDLEYRVLAIVDKQKMYLAIGIFKPTEKTLMRIFEETIETIQIN